MKSWEEIKVQEKADTKFRHCYQKLLVKQSDNYVIQHRANLDLQTHGTHLTKLDVKDIKVETHDIYVVCCHFYIVHFMTLFSYPSGVFPRLPSSNTGVSPDTFGCCRFPVIRVSTSSETNISFCSGEQISYTSPRPFDDISWVKSEVIIAEML